MVSRQRERESVSEGEKEKERRSCGGALLTVLCFLALSAGVKRCGTSLRRIFSGGVTEG